MDIRKTCVAAFAVTIASSSFAGDAYFQGLGFLSGSASSFASDISDDGSFIAGYATNDGSPVAVRWQNGAISSLGISGVSRAYGISGDGNVAVGSILSGSAETAMRWESGTFSELSPALSTAHGVSSDGSLAAGFRRISGNHRAVSWLNGVESFIPGIPSSVPSDAWAVSSNARAVVGEMGLLAGGTGAFRYADGILSNLGSLSTGANSRAYAVSTDGSVVVGGSANQPFRWSEDEGGVMVGLGFLPGTTRGQAWGVSGDGNAIVGSYDTPSGTKAFLWRSGEGVEDLLQVMTDLGASVSGWNSLTATAISADGLTIVGAGNGPDGRFQAFIAHLPEPSTCILLAPAFWILARRRH